MARKLVAPLVGRVPGVCGDRPIVMGTRVQVSDVLAALGGEGETVESVCRAYNLTPAQVAACCAYGARQLEQLWPRS